MKKNNTLNLINIYQYLNDLMLYRNNIINTQLDKDFFLISCELAETYNNILKEAKKLEKNNRLSVQNNIDFLMSNYSPKLKRLYFNSAQIAAQLSLLAEKILPIISQYLEESMLARKAKINPSTPHILLQTIPLPENIKGISRNKLRQEIIKRAPFLVNNYVVHKLFFQIKLSKYYFVGPFCRMIYEKPLGYAGDFRMIQSIYNNAYEGGDLFSKFVNYFSINWDIAKAVRNRLDFLSNKIKTEYSLFKERNKGCNNNFSLASIACGGGVEVLKSLQSEEIINCSIYLLDTELLGWKSILDNLHLDFYKVGNYVKNYAEKNIDIEFFEKSIYVFFRGFKFVKKCNLIYSSGLFDYLNNTYAKRLIESLWPIIEPGGKLIIGNLNSTEQASKIYMEFLSEWYLYYRNEEDLNNLINKNIRESSKVSVEKDDLGVQLYLIIEKCL